MLGVASAARGAFGPIRREAARAARVRVRRRYLIQSMTSLRCFRRLAPPTTALTGPEKAGDGGFFMSIPAGAGPSRMAPPRGLAVGALLEAPGLLKSRPSGPSPES